MTPYYQCPDTISPGIAMHHVWCRKCAEEIIEVLPGLKVALMEEVQE